MSFTVTHYPQGTFSWCDVFSTDMAKTKAFLTQLLGWTTEDMPTTEGQPDYTMFSLEGQLVAGGSPTMMPGQPSSWQNYVSVDDIEATMAEVKKLGGKVAMEPMTVFDSGRMAAFTDPTGAELYLWQPNHHIGAQVVNKVGAMCWNELNSPDVKTAQEFFGKLFGWTFETDEEGYVNIFNNGRRNGGMFPLTGEMSSVPPHWMVYFHVANLDQAVAQTQQLGGSLALPPKDISVGRIAMVADPAGAHSMLIEMSVPPDEWVE